MCEPSLSDFSPRVGALNLDMPQAAALKKACRIFLGIKSTARKCFCCSFIKICNAFVRPEAGVKAYFSRLLNTKQELNPEYSKKCGFPDVYGQILFKSRLKLRLEHSHTGSQHSLLLCCYIWDKNLSKGTSMDAPRICQLFLIRV